MMRVDVVVVGAGAAGLAATRRLTGRGYTVALVDARGRLGGRIMTARHPATLVPLELGAEFVHGMPPEIFALPASAFVLYEIGGETWTARQGRWRPTALLPERTGRLLDEIVAWRGEDQPLSTFLARHAPRGGQAARALRDYVEGFDAADPDRVSVRWLGQSEAAAARISGERQFRLAGGYGPLIAWLRDGLPAEQARVCLNTVVEEIRWDRGDVLVQARGLSGEARAPIGARAAVITLPLGVLLAAPSETGAVRFVPDLSQTWAAAGDLAIGHAIKVVLRFREAFWGQMSPPSPCAPRLSFLSAPDELIRTWWTQYPLVAPLLTGWVAGPRADRLRQETDAEIIGGALAALARIVRMPRADLEALLEGAHLHNWSADPFARGAYSYVCVGGVDAPRRLGAPVAGTLFFAGEATNADGHTGTVHGALATGYRAADEIVRARRPG